MQANANELPLALQVGDATFPATDWGDMRALLISLPAGTDATPLLNGLTNDLCQCAHWGYVRNGRLKVPYDGSSETFHDGDVYYMPSGHTIAVMEDRVQSTGRIRRGGTGRSAQHPPVAASSGRVRHVTGPMTAPTGARELACPQR